MKTIFKLLLLIPTVVIISYGILLVMEYFVL